MDSHLQAISEDSFTLAVKESLDALLRCSGSSLKRHPRILLAFSGGPDSTSLLIAMKYIAAEHNVDFAACHVNHSMRGKESDDDESFCKEICKQLQIPISLCKINCEGSSEAQLRKHRYEQLEIACSELKSNFCLTGHTLDDQVETMLFRLFRGTGPGGFLGIPESRNLAESLILLRPLLGIRRSECVGFLERYGIRARQDSSNSNDSYTRNFLRNQVLPLVENRFPGFRELMEQLRLVMKADESLLSSMCQNAISELVEDSGKTDSWQLDRFAELPLSLRRRVLCEALKERQIECEFGRIESLIELIDKNGPGAVSLNESWEIRIKDEMLEFKSRLKEEDNEEAAGLSIPVRKEGLTLIHRLGLVLKLEKLESETAGLRIPGSKEHEVLGDLSQTGELQFRLREAGDQIQPLGMDCMVRLKKFLHTHKSTETLSFGGRVLVLADDKEVLWVPGCGISQRIAFKQKATHRISLMRINPDETGYC